MRTTHLNSTTGRVLRIPAAILIVFYGAWLQLPWNFLVLGLATVMAALALRGVYLLDVVTPARPRERQNAERITRTGTRAA